MNWAKWKLALTRDVEIPLCDALRAQFPDLLFTGIDFMNALLRVTLPAESADHQKAPSEEAIELVAQRLWSDLWRRGRLDCWFDGPPGYPFETHLPTPVRPVEATQIQDGVLELEWRQEDLLALRAAYEELERRALRHDLVATFASGGMPAVLFLADRKTVAMEKVHLFPGLSWEDSARSKRVFEEWLRKCPLGKSLFIFDTTGTGNALKRIETCLRETFQERGVPFSRVEIVGVQETSQYDALSPWSTEIGTPAVPVSVDVLHVPCLLSEDQAGVIGYDVDRRHSQATGAWVGAIVRIRSGDGRVGIIGGAHASAHFQDALQGRIPLAIREDTLQAAANAYMALLAGLSNAEKRTRLEIEKAFGARWLSVREFEDALDWLKHTATAVRARYQGYLDEVNKR